MPQCRYCVPSFRKAPSNRNDDIPLRREAARPGGAYAVSPGGVLAEVFDRHCSRSASGSWRRRATKSRAAGRRADRADVAAEPTEARFRIAGPVSTLRSAMTENQIRKGLFAPMASYQPAGLP